MQCANCGNEQATGKFCGKCGAAMEATSQQVNTTNAPQNEYTVNTQQTVQPGEPNVHVEKVKETSKQYWSYYLRYLKNPTAILQSGHEFINGIISIVIFALLSSITVYTLVVQIFKATMGGFAELLLEDVNWFSTIASSFFFTLLSMAIVVVSMFLITKFFGPDFSFKTIITHYGALLNGAIVVLVAGLLLILVKAFVFASILIIAASAIATLVVPLYLMGRYLTQRATTIDPFYSYILYIVVFSILTAIVGGIIMDSTIGELINEISLDSL